MNNNKLIKMLLNNSYSEIDKKLYQGEATKLYSTVEPILQLNQFSEEFKESSSRERGELIHLLRRMGFQKWIFKKNKSCINDFIQNKTKLSPVEICEYAAVLISLGLTNNAEMLIVNLSETQKHEYPKSYLYQAFCLISDWEYKKAQNLISKFLSLTEKDEHFYLIGLINLATTFLHNSEYIIANEKIDEVIQIAESVNNIHAKASAFEVKAEILMSEYRFDEAYNYVKFNLEYFNQLKRIESFYSKKWLKLIEIFQNKYELEKSKSIKIDLQNEALRLKSYEPFRDFSYHFLFQYPNLKDIYKLYFGTPYNLVKNKIKSKFFSDENSIPDSIRFITSNKNLYNSDFDFNININSPTFDLTNEIGLNRKILKILFSDWYKPWSIIRIHNKLFKGQWFNPNSSPHLIYHKIYKCREWILDNNLPIDIINIENEYQIIIKGEFNLKGLNSNGLNAIENNELFFHAKIKSLFEKSSRGFYSSIEISNLFNCPLRTVQKYLATLVLNDIIKVKKNGRNKFYFLAHRTELNLLKTPI